MCLHCTRTLVVVPVVDQHRFGFGSSSVAPTQQSMISEIRFVALQMPELQLLFGDRLGDTGWGQIGERAHLRKE